LSAFANGLSDALRTTRLRGFNVRERCENLETEPLRRLVPTENGGRSGCGLYYVRTLFTIYGVNIGAVAVIVTVFMLGLGNLAGGKLSTPSRVCILRR
jgi:hypothetical protein